MTEMRILHIVNSFDIGGMENGVVNLVNYSDSQKFSHAVCALRGVGRSGGLIEPGKATFFSLTGETFFHRRTVFLDIRKVIQDFNPDIIHIRHWGPLWDTVIAHSLTRRRARLVFSYHGKTYHEYCQRSKITSVKRAVLLRCVDDIVTLNDDMVKSLRFEENVKKTITILPNGVDTDKFFPTRTPAALKKELGLPEGRFLFGSVGRFSKIKDIATIIRAGGLLKNRERRFAIIIIGDGDERERLEKLIREENAGDVVFLIGYRENVDRYLRCFDAYVQASLYEGFSNTILEALSSGLPAIVTGVGGNVDLVSAGDNGFLFRPGDYRSLAEYMSVLLSDQVKLEKFSRTARKMAVERWSLKKMIAGYEKFYTGSGVN
jgi:glycosyltransferase involved in cell wall biosynthesis